jgi:serine/threonine protein kinase/WD40 repeat protein
MDLTGRILHHYQILELIGQGGMAEVYRAYHATLDFYVAVKVLYPHLAAQEDFLQRFRQEARAIAKLSHPNIVRVHDFGGEGNLIYMVMELIDGPSLHSCLEEALKGEEYWSLDNILQLLKKVGSAIDYAHQHGMIHRDIKPGNILLRVEQPGDVGDRGYSLASSESSPVLTDFGLAYLVGQAHRSTTGALTGTFAYISPEQAMGERGEQSSDLYSLAIVLYEMITHQIPFAADTPSGLILRRVQETPAPLRELRPDIPEEIEAVVMKALSKSPTDRYPTASALAEAFEQAIKDASLPHPTLHHAKKDTTYKVGDVITDRYEVLDVLGEGGFSWVYKVCDKNSDDVVALKLVSDSSGAIDLRQEFQTLQALDHPSIAKVYDVGLLPNYLYYLKLEYVQGYTLRHCIDQTILTLGKSVELVGDILEALSYLEGRGYIHRDIKPSNIVVTPTGAKIIDFNVSKRLEDSSKTQIGTPRYMAPEVPVFGWNRTCDVFSAGLVFYELTTGSFPFADPAAHAAWDIPHPSELNPALPSSLADIILKALSRDPNDRFQSAAEMLQAVHKASLGEEEWHAETVRPQVAAPSVAQPKIARRELVFDLERLDPISSGNVAYLQMLRRFGSGLPLALGTLAGMSGFVAVFSAGMQAVDPTDGSQTEVIRNPDSGWIAADVSLRGNALAVVDRSRNAFVYGLPAGKSLGSLTNLPFDPTDIVCSDRGLFAAIVDQPDEKTYLWDIDAQRLVAQWAGTTGQVAFGPEENLVAIVTTGGKVHVWRVETGEGVARIDVSGDQVTRLAFNPDGQLLVTGGSTTRVWQVAKNHQVAQWSMEGTVTAVAFSPDSQWIAIASDAGQLELHSTTSGRKLRERTVGRVSDLTIAADGATVHVIEGTAEVCSYDMRKDRLLRGVVQSLEYSSASLSADESCVAASTIDGNVFLWRSQETAPSDQRPWRHFEDLVWGIALDPTGDQLAVGTPGYLSLYNVRRKRPLWQSRIKKRPGRILFSPDGRLVVMHLPGISKLFRATTGKRIKWLRADIIAVSPAGQAMAVIHRNKVRLFDLFTLKSTDRHPVPACSSLALNVTARLLALATPQNALEIWYIQTGHRLGVLSKVMLGLSGHGDRMNPLTFGPDGSLLVSSGSDGTVRIWDTRTGVVRSTLTAHLGPVTSASFGGEGRLFCTSGADGTVRLWGVGD